MKNPFHRPTKTMDRFTALVLVLVVVSIGKVIGQIGWPWHLIWFPIVVGLIFLTLGKLGLYDLDEKT